MRLSLAHDPVENAILIRLAEDGDAAAQRDVGGRLFRGTGGMGRDRRKGLELLRRAAVTDAEAAGELADIEEARGRRAAAFAWRRRAVRLGSVEAESTLGHRFLRGATSDRDVRRGLRLLQRAARRGDSYAALRLGWHACSVRGDVRRARAWFRHALVLGDGDAIWALELLDHAAPLLRRLVSDLLWIEDPSSRDLRQGLAALFGVGRPSDAKEGEAALRRAVDRGDADAMVLLGCLVWNCLCNIDYDEAAEWFGEAAARGRSEAWFGAGALEVFRDRRDRRRGIRRLRRAAALGHARAIYELGEAHATGGEGVPPDEKRAAAWMERAATLGDPDAQVWFAEMCEQGEGVRRDARRAVEWFLRAARHGVPDAQNKLGVCLHEGRGTRREDRAAVRWYRRAARRGDVYAMANLGRCYGAGHGVRQRVGSSRAWMVRAVGAGNARAAWSLGRYFLDGWAGATTPDPVESACWFRRGAAMGDAESLGELGICYHEGNGAPKDLDFAAKCYRLAAQKGDSWATYCLGLCYRDGEGVRRNVRTARAWLRRAAGQGVRKAARALRRLRSRPTGVASAAASRAAGGRSRASAGAARSRGAGSADPDVGPSGP